MPEEPSIEEIALFDARGHVLVSGGPGSGKRRLL
jgi:type IV secretory pathway ATPase VirB11/archaellum biosynthesis ATPase